MKLALRYIPTEVWVDIFCYPWISRRKLGKLVDRFRNRYIAEILQYCLHERGKRTLETICLFKGNDIPPMPENIKFFECIQILHINTQTLAFLRRISGLFTGVNLNLVYIGPDDDLTNLRTALDHTLPLLRGIHSLSFHQCVIPLVEQHFAQQLAQTKMLTFNFDITQYDPAAIQTGINFCLNWLTLEERDPIEPRFLKAIIILSEDSQQFSTAVRQQFLLAQTRCTFAIEFICYDDDNLPADFHLENSMGEQLDGEFNEAGHFQIFRHAKMVSARTQLQAWVKENYGKSNESSAIEFFRFTTVGQIEGNAGANEVNNAGLEVNQPSTSKKQ